MFETTIGVLHESPFALVPLAAIVWFVVQSARRSKIPSRLARYIVVFGAIPPFGLFLLAELAGSRTVRDLARALLDGEIGLLVDILGVIDTVTAAVLVAVLRFVAGVVPSDSLGGFTSVLPSWDPFAAVSALGFLATVFVLQFVTGIAVMRITGREDGVSDTNEWLTAAGVVMFVSGLVWTLLQFDPKGFGRLELQTAVLASSTGLLTGVVASNLSVDLPVNLPTWRSEAESERAETVPETESRPHTRSTRDVSRSDSRTPDAAGSKRSTTAETRTSDPLPSLQRLQETVRSLRRR
ncbi:hypothetical protein [Haladaptatus sp. DYF46]|uniref:hypothetical protein n=1 Tax=Haladaptatus sp. DYF46 TaxID=2886041 RepID=UPI001E409646|nr:hypothetical protein [Haladaptatus sp. DYF46]